MSYIVLKEHNYPLTHFLGLFRVLSNYTRKEKSRINGHKLHYLKEIKEKDTSDVAVS